MTQKTITVRIPVGIDPDGRWNASGWKGCPVKDAFDHLDYTVLGPGEGYQLGYGVRAAITGTWLHARAASMNDPDPKVKAWLDSAATNFGWELDARGKLAAKRKP